MKKLSNRLIVISLIAAILYLAKSVFLPIFYAFFIFLLLSPIIEKLKQYKIPRMLTSSILCTLFLFIFSWSGSFVIKPAAQWLEKSPQLLQNLKKKTRGFKRPIKKIEDVKNQLEDMTNITQQKPPAQAQESKTLNNIGKKIFTVTSDIVFTLLNISLLTFFFLSFGHKIIDSLSEKTKIGESISSIQNHVSKYLLIFSLINIGLGTCITLSLWALDFPNPILWGVLAGFLNFLPYFGPIVGSSIVLIIGLFNYETLTLAMLPALSYLTINSIEGQFVTPVLLGNTLNVNPIAILIMMMIMGWLWGFSGALIAMPLLMVLKICLENYNKDSNLLIVLKD